MQEHTGMFTALVFGVREVRPIELPSYSTGEKTAYLLLWLEVTALLAAWQTLIVSMNQLQALAHQQVLQLHDPGTAEVDDSLSEGSDDAKKGDMLLIQGEGPTDVWYGHVQDVDYLNKTVDVYFFIESYRCQNVFVRESHGRGARNTVSWRSVIELADGQWSGPGMWTRDS